jgi:hypothetical protein
MVPCHPLTRRSRGSAEGMQKRITKRLVDATAIPRRNTWIWDDEVRVFGFRARASGGRFYIPKHAAGRGQSRWITIGRHGCAWTPDTARAGAQLLLRLVAGGSTRLTRPLPSKERRRLFSLRPVIWQTTPRNTSSCEPPSCLSWGSMAPIRTSPEMSSSLPCGV